MTASIPRQNVPLSDPKTGRMTPEWYRFFAEFLRDMGTGDVAAGSGLALAAGVMSIANDGVSNAMLRNSLATSVIGRYQGSTGNPADIQATADDRVLGRFGGQLEFRDVSTIGATVADGDYGDIVVTGSGAAWAFDTGVVTAFARTFLDDAAASNVRTTLGLGTAAVKNTGQSGDALPLCNGGATTWTGGDHSINGRAVGTGGQTFSTVLGGTVVSTGSIAIGDGAAVTAGTNSTVVGRNASCTGSNAVAVGESALAAASGVAIGIDATTVTFNGTALGRGSTLTANNQLVCGSASIPVTAIYFGRGVTHATTTNVVINGTGGSGTDIAGGNMTIAGGKGTGAGTPGNVIIQTSTAAASSSTLQTLATRATFDPTGLAVSGVISCTGNSNLGDASGDVCTITGSATVSNGLAVTTTLSCTGNATLGDAGTDAHTINGSATISNGLAVTGSSTASTYLKPGSFTVAGLPSAATSGAGAIAYASNARKAGEGAGAGTGIPVWSDATNWKTFYDNTTAAA